MKTIRMPRDGVSTSFGSGSPRSSRIPHPTSPAAFHMLEVIARRLYLMCKLN